MQKQGRYSVLEAYYYRPQLSSYLKYFQNKIGNEHSPLCDKCGEDIETVSHFLTKCPAFALHRYQTFGAFELRDTNINFVALLDKLLAFGKLTRYLEFYGEDDKLIAFGKSTRYLEFYGAD